jgi:hypothetical protein
MLFEALAPKVARVTTAAVTANDVDFLAALKYLTHLLANYLIGQQSYVLLSADHKLLSMLGPSDVLLQRPVQLLKPHALRLQEPSLHLRLAEG